MEPTPEGILAASGSDTTSDVVVVGAGLSGLVAARELSRAGLEVLVLEARDRPGGRTHTAEISGVTVDLGGEWVDEAHREMRGLCEELGLDLLPSDRSKSEARWYLGGSHHERAPFEDRDAAIYRRFEEALMEAVSGTSLDRPWESAPGSDEDTSVADWLSGEGMSDHGLHVAETMISTCGSTVPISRMSFHAYAAKTASRGGPGRGNEYRVAGGAGSVSRRLAEDLGERVRYLSPVTAVIQRESGVEVRFQSPGGPGAVWARRAVLALPFTCYGGIRFDPEPPSAVRRMAARSVYGVVRKTFFVFDREIDHRVTTVTDTHLGYLYAARSPEGRAPEGIGAAVSFAGGRPLLPELGLPTKQRLRRAAETLGHIRDDLPQPVAVEEKVWPADPWTRGSYMILAPGDLADFGRSMGGGFGRVHLAGAEGAAVAPSFMNSAVRSGLAAGRRAAEALRGKVEA